VYAIQGTSTGERTFDLNTWLNGNGGEWQNWFVQNGVFQENEASAPDCMPLNIKEPNEQVWITNSDEGIQIHGKNAVSKVEIINTQGSVIYSQNTDHASEPLIYFKSSNAILLMRIYYSSGSISVLRIAPNLR
jgi:hypothetical protein